MVFFSGSKRVGCVLVICMMLVLVFPVTIRFGHAAVLSEACVLWEKITVSTCGSCNMLSAYEDELFAEYGPKHQLAIIEIHGHKTGIDELADSSVLARVSYYEPNATVGTPQIMTDGMHKTGYMFPSEWFRYKLLIDFHINITRDFEISVSGDLASGSATVHLVQTNSNSATNLMMRYAVLENHVYCAYSDMNYSFVARTMPPSDPVSSIPPGGRDFIKTFTVKPEWNTSNLAFVAFLQSDTDKNVLQSCYYSPSNTVTELNLFIAFPFSGLIALIIVASRKKGGDYVKSK